MDFDLGEDAGALRARLRALVADHFPDEFLGAFTDDDTALLISYSGETEEVVELVTHLKRRGIRVVANAGGTMPLPALIRAAPSIRIP